MQKAIALQLEELEVMETPLEWYWGVAIVVGSGAVGVAAGYGVAALIAFT